MGTSGGSDAGAPDAGEGGAGSFKGPFTPHAESGATPIATTAAKPIAIRRIRAVKSRTIEPES
jgi:hypothetical protein